MSLDVYTGLNLLIIRRYVPFHVRTLTNIFGNRPHLKNHLVGGSERRAKGFYFYWNLWIHRSTDTTMGAWAANWRAADASSRILDARLCCGDLKGGVLS